MTIELKTLQDKVEQLSIDDLLELMERITKELRLKTETNSQIILSNLTNIPDSKITIPGAYQLTPEEIEADLTEIFTAEELIGINAATPAELLTLPTLPKSLAEMISEDREDRL